MYSSDINIRLTRKQRLELERARRATGLKISDLARLCLSELPLLVAKLGRNGSKLEG